MTRVTPLGAHVTSEFDTRNDSPLGPKFRTKTGNNIYTGIHSTNWRDSESKD